MWIALVTNAPEENVEAILLALKLRDFFDTVVLADEVEAVKPDPAPYIAALEKTGVPAEEALAFEDSISGISSSVAAGIPTVGIASSQEPAKLLGAGAFMAAQDFTDPQLSPHLAKFAVRAVYDPPTLTGMRPRTPATSAHTRDAGTLRHARNPPASRRAHRGGPQAKILACS